ncbi:MAG: hypothetical protein RL033_7824 [Pseudomonadota bacterium]
MHPFFDWGGIRIVNPPVVRVPRVLPGGTTVRVKMDVRGFVPSRPSAVLSRWVGEQLEKAVQQHPWLVTGAKTDRKPSSFDTIAHLVADSVFSVIIHKPRGGSAWQLPEETLARGAGDCEDRAILLAAALVAAGISPYVVRVALGSVAVSSPRSEPKQHAHAWVVYRSELGPWLCLEPLASAQAATSGLTFDYEPEYVFNGDHQWAFSELPDRALRARWNALKPRFHGDVHKSIIDVAAARAGLPEPLRTRLARTFSVVFGHVIDGPDIAFRSYKPEDHFDSGRIEASWARVNSRLERFYESTLTDSLGIQSACEAVHAIGDFYSHSTYAHFLRAEGVQPEVPYDPRTRKPQLAYDYPNDPAFRSAQGKLTFYDKWWKPGGIERFELWKGSPISGRYSFQGDSQGFIEGITNVPGRSSFPTDDDRSFAGSLPHHDEIAVDEDTPHTRNALYPEDLYALQFKLRYELALKHIEDVLAAHPDLQQQG